MKITTNEKIRTMKFKKPNVLVGGAFKVLTNILFRGRTKLTIHRSVDLNKYKNLPVIVASNHESRLDYAFISMAMKGRRINYMAEENEFHRSHLAMVFQWEHNIPKKNFVPDITAIKAMGKILKREKAGCVSICPCGLSTASGAQQPCVNGTGKLMKHFGVHVLGLRMYGGYFVSPKFNVKERWGKVEMELFEMFTPEQLKQLSEDEVQRIMDEQLYTDDYQWNETRQYSYKCKGGVADQLEQLVYKCPKCGAEMRMLGKGNEIKCLECGNGGTLDNKYNLVPFQGSTLPKNLRVWFDDQRRFVYKEVQNPNFVLEDHVKMGVLPEYGYVPNKQISVIVGEGLLHLDSTGMTYDGTRDGKPYKVFIPSHLLMTVVTPVDASFFDTYASGEFLSFHPDRASVMKWTFAIEEIYRKNGGVWKNYPWFNYEEDTPLEGYPLYKRDH